MPVIANRSPARGFIADGQTHAEFQRNHYAIEGYCRRTDFLLDVREIGTFRVTPGAPLCRECVEGIELQIRRTE